MSKRYLTKSRFKSALECPTKLYYTRKDKEYADKSKKDKFLSALAEGDIRLESLQSTTTPMGLRYYQSGTMSN